MLKKIFFLSASLMLMVTIGFSRLTFAKDIPFILLESHHRTITKIQLDSMELARSKAQISKNGKALILPDTLMDLIIRTGPESDMLSYRIQNLRNPTLIVRANSRIHILFVNVDDDMTHDVRMGNVIPPDTAGTAGTAQLPHSDNDNYSAEEITIRAGGPGKYPYFCSYRSHAANGMRGWIIVAMAGATAEEMKQLAIDTTGTPEPMGMEGMDGMPMNMMDMPLGHEMPMTGMLRTEQMAQEGSGTSWQPVSSPMYMSMQQLGDWMLMLHGSITPRYDYQGGPRGGNKIDAPNWGMAMLGRSVGPDGQFTAHLMMSLDPLTEGGKGYPLLFQTGETWQAQKLVDDQHPHDLFDEVSIAYSHRFASDASGYIYLGYPGEPALGPPVFMHRPSAMADPDAPISHHWMDATHITFGVATAGITIGEWKVEASTFNGSEPDENRYDFDKLQINSYSGRLSFNPTSDFAFQISIGHIKNPEGDSVDVIRSTASAIYNRNYGNGTWWATTLAFGENHEMNFATQGAILLESQYTIPNYSFFGRAEYVQKSDAELNLSSSRTMLHDLSYVDVGLTRTLVQFDGIELKLGGQATYHFVPQSLQILYSAHPVSYEVFFQFQPSLSPI